VYRKLTPHCAHLSAAARVNELDFGEETGWAAFRVVWYAITKFSVPLLFASALQTLHSTNSSIKKRIRRFAKNRYAKSRNKKIKKNEMRKTGWVAQSVVARRLFFVVQTCIWSGQEPKT
jgi:hypothetical protein